MIAHDTRMEKQSNVETMIEWKAIQLAWTRKFATVSLRLGWEKLDRWNWGEVSQHELKGVERRRKRWKESWGEPRRCAQKCRWLKRVYKRWEVVGRFEVVSQFAARGQKPRIRAWKSAAASRQTSFLHPVALHFLNLETFATRLARVLLVRGTYHISVMDMSQRYRFIWYNTFTT